MGTRQVWSVPPRVLVVDDEPTPRMAITDALSLMGYQAEGVASGAEALARLAFGAYDLMLLDLRMPGMDGVEVLKRARSFRADLQVIVLTAYGSLDSAIEAVRAGAADYLLKPCTIRDTEAAISAALLRRREVSFDQAAYLLRSAPAVALGEQVEEAEPAPISAEQQTERFLRRGPVTLDREKRLAIVARLGGPGTVAAELTGSEASLLDALMQRSDVVSSCRDLAWNALEYRVSEQEAQEIVRPHISRLRHKIEPDPDGPCLVRTVRGKGYMFSPPRVSVA